MPDRPNILRITTDQQFADAMSCAGNDWVDTPAMDRLAEAGTRFTRAYCTNPSCAPSRAAMFTGLRGAEAWSPHEDTFIHERYHDRALGTVLSEAGYECATAGKWAGDRYDQVENQGFEHLAKKDDLRLPAACRRFFERDHDDPFFLAANIDNPHNICQWARGYNPPWGLVEEVPASEHPPLPPNFAIPPDEPNTIHDYGMYKRSDSPMWDSTPAEWREYRHAYFRLVEKADAVVGGILDALEAAGHADDTIIVFVSDHGDGLGAHQLIQKKFLYEEMMRVPLIVRHPGEDGGVVNDRLVSAGYDLYPTILAYAGIEPPEPTLGRDLSPIVAGDDPDPWREYLVCETTRNDLDGRMVRTGRYKYVLYHNARPNEQLFDLETDPGELVNLASRARYRSVLDRHRDLLVEWCEETGDAVGASHYYPGVPMVPGRPFEELAPRFLDQPPAEIPDELEPPPQHGRKDE